MSSATFLRPTAQTVVTGRRRRSRRRAIVTVALAVGVALVFVASLLIGQTFYGLDEVVRVLRGDTVPGSAPRALAVLCATAAASLCFSSRTFT